MPQLGRLSSRSLSGLVPNGSSLSSQFSSISWSEGPSIVSPTGVSNFGGSRESSVTDGVNIYICPAVGNNRIAIYNIASGAMRIATLPTPAFPFSDGLIANKVAANSGKVIVIGLGTSVYSPYGIWSSSDYGQNWSIQTLATPLGSNGESLSKFKITNFTFFDGYFHAFYSYTPSMGSPSVYSARWHKSSNGTTWPTATQFSLSTNTDSTPFGAVASSSGITPPVLCGLSSNTNLPLYRLQNDIATSYNRAGGGPGASSGQQIAWIPEKGWFISYAGAGAAYYITASSLISGGDFVTWGAPGTGQGRVTVLSNGVQKSVIYYTAWTQANPSKISFDAGDTFSSTALPTSTNGIYGMVGFGDKLYCNEYVGTTTAKFYVGTLT